MKPGIRRALCGLGRRREKESHTDTCQTWCLEYLSKDWRWIGYMPPKFYHLKTHGRYHQTWLLYQSQVKLSLWSNMPKGLDWCRLWTKIKQPYMCMSIIIVLFFNSITFLSASITKDCFVSYHGCLSLSETEYTWIQ